MKPMSPYDPVPAEAEGRNSARKVAIAGRALRLSKAHGLPRRACQWAGRTRNDARP